MNENKIEESQKRGRKYERKGRTEKGKIKEVKRGENKRKRGKKEKQEEYTEKGTVGIATLGNTVEVGSLKQNEY